MLELKHSYDQCVEVSERVAWKLGDVLRDKKFDLSRRFLPESLAQVEKISCLTDAQKLRLNQIRGLTYAHLFGFVEEFIVKEAGILASSHGPGALDARRAWHRFAEEEVKHQILFERTKAMLLEQLGPCELVSGAADVAGFVLSKSQLCVLLLTVMLEWTTLHHYVDVFRTNEERERLDPQFVRIFESHWIEESQHTKLDQLEVVRAAKQLSEAEREKAIDEVLEVGGAFDGLLKGQAELDIKSLEAGGKPFTAEQRQEILQAQHAAYRHTFLVSGLKEPNFTALVDSLTPCGGHKIASAATALSA